MSVKIGGVTVHESVTSERVVESVRACTFGLENTGICIGCGEERDGCEPDARLYPCHDCGERLVFGAEELLFYLEA